MCKRLLKKRSAISACIMTGVQNNIEKYKVTKKTTKRAVSEAKGRAYEDLYRRLSRRKERRTFIGWLWLAIGRQGTSTKSSA